MTKASINAVTDARIDSVEVSAYTVPTDAPEADGTISWDSTTMVLVRTRSGDVEGIGWTYGPTACATLVKDELADVVNGRNAMDVAGASQAMIRAVRNAGRPGIAGYAISAVDVALWDLKARLLDVPLHHLLGAVRTEVPVYGSGGFTTYDIRVMAAAADLDVRWFEEPVSSDDLDGLHEVRDAVSPDVTAGEYGYDVYYFRRMCAAGAVDCLQADVSRCGGISEFVRVAAVAASFGLQVSGHCGPHLHAHVAAATPNLRHLEWFHDHVRIESMFFDGTLDPSGGTISPDAAAPGLGLTLRVADAEPYRVA